MDQRLSFFTTHVVICVTQDESDGCKEVGFTRAISSNHDVVMGGEVLNDGFIFVCFETSYDHPFDVHYCFGFV